MHVKCRASIYSSPDPVDCSWPHCGCDERASKVVESLQEEGWGDLWPWRRAVTALLDCIDKGSNFYVEVERLRELNDN